MLAPILVKHIGLIIGQLRSSSISILLVEQNVHMALSVSDDVYIISKGVIVQQSRPEDLWNNMEAMVHYEDTIRRKSGHHALPTLPLIDAALRGFVPCNE